MLTGTATVDELTTHAARLDSFDTPGITLRGVEILQSLVEISIGGRPP